ncbi:NrfD/PsrC family molybdoenzyme membrane anchor subunit [Thermus sp.]|uniref:NrfD/PsrC family molybdoenzyme membrane anchor subunit n=1 Tax=Thermus sp. TaxID=275 RepID=UPI00307DB511
MVQVRRNPLWVGFLWVAFIALALFGGVGIAERFLTGHRLAAYGSYVPWGLWVAAYIYFIGLSAGAFLLSSLVYVFGVHRLEKIGKLALYVAAITLVMALMTIWFDLGHLERFYYVFLRPQFHSMMAWMVWLYTAYFLLLLGELFFAVRRDLVRLSPEAVERDNRILRILGTIGVPLAIAFHGGVGALFGTVVAREYWHSPIYPILFLTGALVSGGALMTFLVAWVYPKKDEEWRGMLQFLGRIVLGLVLFDLLLEWAEYSIPMWYGVGSEYKLLTYVLFGPYWYVYWIFHVLLGVAIPVWLLATRSSSPRAVALASILVAVTFFAVRLNLVIPGLITPELRGLERSYQDPIAPFNRLSYAYFPSLFEWQVLAGVVAIGIALFYLGYRYLPLIKKEVA